MPELLIPGFLCLQLCEIAGVRQTMIPPVLCMFSLISGWRGGERSVPGRQCRDRRGHRTAGSAELPGDTGRTGFNTTELEDP